MVKTVDVGEDWQQLKELLAQVQRGIETDRGG